MHEKVIVILTIAFLYSCSGESGANQRITDSVSDTLICLSNDAVSVSISRFGGAVIEFSFNKNPCNPLSWNVPMNEMPENNNSGAPFQGHFLCIGRWGAPTPAEIALGIPHNGEPANIWWKNTGSQTQQFAEMEVTATLEQLHINRRITLSPDQACWMAEETLENLQTSGRQTAIVQHATIGTPFLSEQAIVSSNASYGFNQSLISESLGKYEYKWPTGFADTLRTQIDLRKSDSKESYVSTHIIEDEIGWATLANPSEKLLIGYLWKTSDYPWLHIWHGIRDGELRAKGIEFGTTGLGDTFSPEQRAAIRFHERNNNLFLDNRASVTKKYYCFLLQIPDDFISTDSISFEENTIRIKYSTKKQLAPVIFDFKVW